MTDTSLAAGASFMTERRRPTLEGLAVWMTGHEQLCGERHGTTNLRLGRIEKILMGMAAAVLAGGATALWELFKISAHILP